MEQELSDVNQNFITAKINSSWKEKFNAQYKFDYLENTGLYKGLRNQLDANYKTEKDEIVAQANVLSKNFLNSVIKFLTLFYILYASRKISIKIISSIKKYLNKPLRLTVYCRSKYY